MHPQTALVHPPNWSDKEETQTNRSYNRTQQEPEAALKICKTTKLLWEYFWHKTYS